MRGTSGVERARHSHLGQCPLLSRPLPLFYHHLAIDLVELVVSVLLLFIVTRRLYCSLVYLLFVILFIVS